MFDTHSLHTGRTSRALSDPPVNLLTDHDDAFTVETRGLGPAFKVDRAGKHNGRRHSKDDHDAFIPSTPRHERDTCSLLARGLNLHLPTTSQPTEQPSSPHRTPTAPLSPRLDAQSIYMQSHSQTQSPATSLPRHSRGLDFSRACTTLAHSTLADRSSPDLSPVISQRGMNIPSRKMSFSGMTLDSPHLHGLGWASLGGPERSTVSSSVGSVNMLPSDSESTSDDEDASMAGDDPLAEDPLFMTPQIHRLQSSSIATPFNPQSTLGGGSLWGSGAHFSPAPTSLAKTIRKHRLARTGGRRTRQSSSSISASGYPNSMPSPRNLSPPPMRSIETSSGYPHNISTAARSRRESLALGTDGLHLSSGNDSGDEGTGSSGSAVHATPSTPAVVRRAVTRRGNLLPKTKGFARIRAALMEEAAPVDTDVRREAETIRQVRERDSSVSELDLMNPNHSGTAASSPNLLPVVPEDLDSAGGGGGGSGGEVPPGSANGRNNISANSSFAAHASRNGGGMDYWNRFDPALRTPPPLQAPPAFTRHGSSTLSEIGLESPLFGQHDISAAGNNLWRRPRARSSASDASDAFHPGGSSYASAATNSTGNASGNGNNHSTVTDDMHLQNFKRRREDDYGDLVAAVKRRAVSPGMNNSAQNSPVLRAVQSPSSSSASASRDHNAAAAAATAWGKPPEQRGHHRKDLPSIGGGAEIPPGLGGRASSGGSSSAAGTPTNGGGTLVSQGKKLGLQPMADTNDGLMKMSIE